MVFVSLKYWSAWCNGLGPIGRGVFHLSIFESKNPTALGPLEIQSFAMNFIYYGMFHPKPKL